MKMTDKQIAKFALNNDMIALAGDMFEDAGGNVIHESEVVEMIEAENASSLDNFFGDVSGALNKLSIIK
jgi:hypothetical protein